MSRVTTRDPFCSLCLLQLEIDLYNNLIKDFLFCIKNLYSSNVLDIKGTFGKEVVKCPSELVTSGSAVRVHLNRSKSLLAFKFG